jgi:hypothetical protein
MRKGGNLAAAVSTEAGKDWGVNWWLEKVAVKSLEGFLVLDLEQSYLEERTERSHQMKSNCQKINSSYYGIHFPNEDIFLKDKPDVQDIFL